VFKSIVKLLYLISIPHLVIKLISHLFSLDLLKTFVLGHLGFFNQRTAFL